ncbi:MAG: MFS transporter [Alphaproteobacteria bacterium]|nr:MFS transporter [Alphaproteobacteria bacterium]
MAQANNTHAAGSTTPGLYWLVARVFLPFALGYFFSYLYRAVNAVIGPALVDELGLSAGGLGLLTSAYFIAFAVAQLPLGFFLDSHGPRRTEAVLLVVAAAGALVFSLGEGLWGLVLGRAMIGVGVAACLMASFKAMSEWFPREKLPLANGFIMASGGLGVFTATAPTQFVVAEIGWRYGFVALAIATLAAALILWTAVPERPRETGGGSVAEQIGGLREIYGSLAFWRIAPVTALTQGTFLAIQTLWAGPWLRDVAGLDPVAVSFTLLYGAVGFVFGNIAVGFIAMRLGRRGVAPIVVVGVGMAAFLVMQLLVIGEWVAAPRVLWFVFGMLGSVGVLSFAVLTHEFPAHLTGRASTGMNLLVFSSAFALQWGIGEIINLWPSAADGGYAASGYQTAFVISLALQTVALGWMIFGRRLTRA